MKTVLTLLVAIIGSSTTSMLIQRYLSKSDYEISAISCSESGPSKVFLENTDNGYKIEIPNADIPASLDRITKITNTGLKTIDGETINISIDNDKNGTVFEYIVFYSNVLDEHDMKYIDVPDGSKLFAFKFKKFNPNDQITILTNSTKQLSVSANSKGNGYTYYQKFEDTKYCKYFDFSGYGGKIVYSSLAKGCKLNPKNLNLSCDAVQSIKVPSDFPPGKARVIYEEEGLMSWLPWWPKKISVLNFNVVDNKAKD